MAKPFSAVDRQKHIYLNGLSGRRPLVPVDTEALQETARRHMSKAGYAYVAGGAGREITLTNNRSGFNRWQIVPRMLRDVSQANTQQTFFGQSLPYPLMLAPVGVLEMAHPEGDIPVAKAAARLGVPMIFSNQASVPVEDWAAAMGDTPRWFQLYWSKSNELVASFLERAENCGCRAIVVTLDTTMPGWRARDLDLGFLPFMRGMGIAQYVSDPVFQRLIDEPDAANLMDAKPRPSWAMIQAVLSLMRNYPGNLLTNLRTQRPIKAMRKFINVFINPAITWDDLSFLREHTRLPILLKGILHPQDAQKALDYGIDGIIVSNHGGRQVDGAVSAIEALPDIASVVGTKIPILLDSGIRTGADMFKAIALGATAVCLGRPYVYGLAIAGEAGVREVLENILADFELTMRLAGCRNLEEIREAGVRVCPDF
jgi:lactate 2-monooxygenase